MPANTVKTNPTPQAPSHLQLLAAQGQSCHFEPGQLLLKEGEESSHLYILLSGRLRVFKANAQGRQLTLANIDPIECVGEMSLDGSPRSANVNALEPSVCARVDRQTLLNYFRQEPEFALELLQQVIFKVRMASRQAGHLALLDTYHRLSLWIQAQAIHHNAEGFRTTHAVTHTELAEQIGCTREMVSRLLKDLQAGQYIRMDQRCLVVLRPLPQRW
jgi:CRP/FNR family transcriptional regulator, cyclic AMP receptor protein